jgi:hypothetical protein
MTWVLSAGLNLVIAVCYFCISGLIARGLVRAGEWRTNRLGVATAGIFYTCAVHHGLHTLHMLEPTLGFHSPTGLAMREAFDWHSVASDMVGAGHCRWRRPSPPQPRCQRARRPQLLTR